MTEALSSSGAQAAKRAMAPALIGRAREQAALRDLLTIALDGQGRLAVVGGEAGIGKTTLARDLAREARARGALVLIGHCYDLTNTPPYGPWLDLFAGYHPGFDLPPPAAFAGGALTAVPDQATLFAEVCRFFAALTAARPVLVVLEDLHWSDPASLDLLRHLGVHLRHWPALLLATYRVDELTRRHPLYQQLPALVRDADGLRLDLHPLAADDLRALVAARYALPAAAEARLVAYLDQHADGNPFFATELLRALEEEAILRPATDGWMFDRVDHVVVPSFLRQVLDGRIARLGEETRQALALAAVIGQEAPLDLWAAVAEIDHETVLTVVERATEGRLLDTERDGSRVRFVHALTREALYEGIVPPRRRLQHRRVAEALLAGAHPDPDAVAYHLEAAGDPRAWEWLERAAERAQRAYAWHTAADRLQAAAALLDGIEGQERRRGWLLYRMARLFRFSYPERSLAATDEVERLALQAGDAVLAGDINYTRGVVLGYLDQFSAGTAAMARGIAALEAMPLEQAKLPPTLQAWLADSLPATAAVDSTADETVAILLHAEGLHSRSGVAPHYLASSGRPREAAAIGERFVALLADVPGARGVVRSALGASFSGLGIAYAALGRPDDARPAFERGAAFLEQLDHHGLISFVLLSELHDVALAYDAAKPAVRRRLSARLEDLLARAGGALRPGVSPRLAWLSCLVLDGRWDEADQILRDLPPPGNCYLRRERTGAIAFLARGRGESETAWEEIRPLFPRGAATEPGDLIHQEGLALQRLAADLHLDAGDWAGARTWLEAHDRWLAWSSGVFGQAAGHLAWARYHRATGEPTVALGHAETALALASSPAQPLVLLAAHRLLGELDTATGDHTAAETHLAASLALADACEAPFERALTLLALAELRLRSGAVAEGAAILDDVRGICFPLGAAPTLARADALAPPPHHEPGGARAPAGLSPREIEVLRLLVQHLTDKEIAEALFLGPRTIQTHVGNILNKLGVENRREAAREAVRLGLG